MSSIQVPGSGLAFEDRGNGIPILFIHGYPLNRRMWESQWEGLAKQGRIIAPDLRGHGESILEAGSFQKPYPFTMDLLAEDCLQLLDNLKITKPVILCGLSMGGYVCFAFYRKYRQRVSGLILAATRAGADSPEAKNSRLQTVEKVQRDGVESIAETMLPRMLSPQSFQKRSKLVEDVRQIILSSTVEGVIGDSLGMKDRVDSTSMLSAIHVPVLVLTGADDQIIPTREAEEMQAAIPAARLVTLPEAGHLLNMEQPDLFNSEVQEFIHSIAGGKR